MAPGPTRKRNKHPGSLPDLVQAKSAVLNTLSSADAQRGYQHAIDEFIEWYCSEPRLSFNRAVVVRYRMYLEQRRLAPGTIDLRLGAVRRLAYEGVEHGLLSPDLAAVLGMNLFYAAFGMVRANISFCSIQLELLRFTAVESKSTFPDEALRTK